MLKRIFRLPKGTRFNNSRLLSSPLFIIKVRENGLSFNRFTIIVSKKIDKRAVVRNRIKRLISSCIEELYKDLRSGCDMIFIVKKGVIGKKRTEFCSEIKHNLDKV